MSANKVIYGISHAVAFPITAESDAGVPTYGTAINLPGCTALTMSAAGGETPFYADNVKYFNVVSNTGYTGSITLADIPDEFLEKILGEVAGDKGSKFEKSDAKTQMFALAFEFEGDKKKRRHIFYRCSATRPEIASSTVQDSVTPNTNSINLTAMARLDNNIIRAHCEEGDGDYSNWYTAPVEYTAAKA